MAKEDRNPPPLEVTGLVVRYGGRPAVDGLGFRLERGEILALLGPNGAGKSSTVRCLAGLREPEGGEAKVFGLRTGPDRPEARRRLAYVPENAPLYEVLTPRETLALKGRLHGISEELCETRSESLLELLDLAEVRDRPIHALSRGMKQKVCLAAALLTDPEILILDEPLSGLDLASVELLVEVLRRLASAGRSILYCSHLLAVVGNLADRVLVLDRGRLAGSGRMEDLKRMGSDLSRFVQETARMEDPETRAKALLDLLEREKS